MKRIPAGVAMLFLLFCASAGTAKAQQHAPVKIFLSPRSMVPEGEIVRHLQNRCPNITITMDSKKSDYMLDATGWSGRYRFTLFRHGGDAVFSTTTQMLTNSVKDVCKFINSQSNAPTNAPGPEAKPATK
jgi:hypothetical protein